MNLGGILKRHTVILGAGATIAAIPKGDKNGKKSSVMVGLIEKLGLGDLLENINLTTKSKNLEDIYSELHERKDCLNETKALEEQLYNYFNSLEIPDIPTIYDFLILSLTTRDMIVTFNWDPLLVQAYNRCHKISKDLPNLHFLHGNTGVAFCKVHDEYGMKNMPCPKCGERLSPVPLLYPVKEKNYNQDQYINNAWDTALESIKGSHMLTIFGYSAPSSDKEAVSLLKKAWEQMKGTTMEELKEVSIIDIEPEDSLAKKWSNFTYSDHYYFTDNFFDSYLGMFPRRSGEMVFATTVLGLQSNNNNGFKEGMTWRDIETSLVKLLSDEKTTEKSEDYPTYSKYFEEKNNKI